MEFINVYLGNKYNIAVTKKKVIQCWGEFDLEFRRKLKEKLRQQNIKEEIAIDNILSDKRALRKEKERKEVVLDKISLSYNHAIGIDQRRRSDKILLFKIKNK